MSSFPPSFGPSVKLESIHAHTTIFLVKHSTGFFWNQTTKNSNFCEKLLCGWPKVEIEFHACGVPEACYLRRRCIVLILWDWETSFTVFDLHLLLSYVFSQKRTKPACDVLHVSRFHGQLTGTSPPWFKFAYWSLWRIFVKIHPVCFGTTVFCCFLLPAKFRKVNTSQFLPWCPGSVPIDHSKGKVYTFSSRKKFVHLCLHVTEMRDAITFDSFDRFGGAMAQIKALFVVRH